MWTWLCWNPLHVLGNVIYYNSMFTSSDDDNNILKCNIKSEHGTYVDLTKYKHG